MRLYRYPGIDSHIEEHENLINDLEGRKWDVKNGSLMVIQLHEFFVTWVGAHTFSSDKEMGEFIKNQRKKM